MIQDPTKDPYGDVLRNEREQAAKAPEAGGLVNLHGNALETPTGKERRELRQQQKRMKEGTKVHVKTFVHECDDGIVRFAWEVVTVYPGGREYHLSPFSYSKEQLQAFINEIEEFQNEIETKRLEEESAEESPGPEDVGTPGD